MTAIIGTDQRLIMDSLPVFGCTNPEMCKSRDVQNRKRENPVQSQKIDQGAEPEQNLKVFYTWPERIAVPKML